MLGGGFDGGEVCDIADDGVEDGRVVRCVCYIVGLECGDGGAEDVLSAAKDVDFLGAVLVEG